MTNIQDLLQHFRSLFPYWKFFDRLGGFPRLYFRYSNQEGISEWRPLHPLQKLKIKNLFINEKVNLMHWEQSQLLQLIEESKNLKKNQLANHEIYIWMKNRVAFELQDKAYDWFQFRINIQSYQNQEISEDLWIESESFERSDK
jgi:hypothetical protein